MRQRLLAAPEAFPLGGDLSGEPTNGGGFPLGNFSICLAQSTAFGTLLDGRPIDFTNMTCD
jgi:hypothetical protein